ncbi:hypothetical protein ThvES_00007910 [Thiovulum sp. ES]|nr:hypothetical protein ThvES_00007910 [Thiovulum sp. ES]
MEKFSYKEAIDSGEIFLWQSGQIASADRFNQNIEYLSRLIENHRTYMDSKFSTLDKSIVEIQKKTETIQDSLSELSNKSNTFVDSSTHEFSISELSSNILKISNELNTLKESDELDNTLSLLDSLKSSLTDSNQESLSSLITDRPTRAEISKMLYSKVNIADVYTKPQMDTKLFSKVTKQEGKSLSTMNFTKEDRLKLDGIEANATRDQTVSELNMLSINATTVNGHTVKKDVPSDAKLTDTVIFPETSQPISYIEGLEEALRTSGFPVTVQKFEGLPTKEQIESGVQYYEQYSDTTYLPIEHEGQPYWKPI